MGVLRLESVWKTYEGGIEAVRGIDLEVADGELLVLVGPSGCGKSTLLRLIAGLEELTSGQVRLDGRVIDGVPPGERDLSMVFQSYALYPHMSVRENLSFGLRLRGTARAEIDRRVAEVAATLEIAELLDRRPRALSGGQRQRVALGRAMVRQPTAFLFDEPLSNLDAKLRVQMRAELKRLHRRLRTTTIYVTHDQEEAMTLGDRIAVLDGGRIQQVGPPLEVYRRPSNRFVAGFVGTPPMSFLEGRLAAEDGALVVEVEGARLGAPCGTTLEGLRAGGPVVVGLRPEGLRVAPTGTPRRPEHIEARVSVVEPLGERADVCLVTRSGAPLVSRVDAAGAPREEAMALLEVLPGALHLFQAGAEGRSLLERSG